MEAVPSIPCHQPAFCQMHLCFFPVVGEGHFLGDKTVKSDVFKRFQNFFLNTVTGDVQYAKVSKPLQPEKEQAAAGAQMPRRETISLISCVVLL